VNQRVSDRVVTETAGNPLALMEFAAELTEDQLAGISPLPGPMRFGGRLEELYRSRVEALPEDARRLLLVAARTIASSDPRLARDTLLDAFGAAQWSGQFGVATAEVLTVVKEAPRVVAARMTTTCCSTGSWPWASTATGPGSGCCVRPSRR
jgi:hypothetical protein